MVYCLNILKFLSHYILQSCHEPRS